MSDIDTAAQLYIDRQDVKTRPGAQVFSHLLVNAFRAGAKWQREQCDELERKLEVLSATQEVQAPEPATCRVDEDGGLDEITGNGPFHLERMDNDQWWMALPGVELNFKSETVVATVGDGPTRQVYNEVGTPMRAPGCTCTQPANQQAGHQGMCPYATQQVCSQGHPLHFCQACGTATGHHGTVPAELCDDCRLTELKVIVSTCSGCGGEDGKHLSMQCPALQTHEDGDK